MYLKVSSEKSHPLCLGVDELKHFMLMYILLHDVFETTSWEQLNYECHLGSEQ